MSALFAVAEKVDALGTHWQYGTPDDVNELLAREHYLGPIAAGGADLVTVGIASNEVVAAQVWRRPTSRNLPPDGTWLELSRWCLTRAAGPNAGSRQHRYAVGLIRELLPKVTTLVSYSDPSHGHSGALYRACNWQWWPTWQRLRPPPTGNGAWVEGQPQAVKDRWVFPMSRDERRENVLKIEDLGAIRHWLSNATESERRWARHHPQLRRQA